MVEKYKDNPLEGTLEYCVWFFAYADSERHLKFNKETGVVIGEKFNSITTPTIVSTPSRDNEDLYRLYLEAIDVTVEEAYLNNYFAGAFQYRGLMSQYFHSQGKSKKVLKKLKKDKPHLFIR